MTTHPEDEDVSPAAMEWLKGKTAKDFDVLEHLGGRLLWPVTLQRQRRGPKGKPTWTEEPAYLHVLDGIDLISATTTATELFDSRGLKIDDPRHQAVWAEVEMHAHVARALREAVDGAGKPYPLDADHPQKATLEMLLDHKASGISRAEVARLYDVLQAFGRFQEGKLAKMSSELVVKIAMAISEVRNCSPLLAIAGSEQDTCIVYMADLLVSYCRGTSSSPSPESLKTAP